MAQNPGWITEIAHAYDLRLSLAAKLVLPVGDHENQVHALEDETGARYVLKELRSPLPDLDGLHEQLARAKPQSYRLVLPVASRSGGLSVSVGGKQFLLMRFIEHTSHANTPIAPHLLLPAIESFHRDVEPLYFPARPQKTYESYLRRGISRVKIIFPNAPLISAYEDFLTSRFPKLDFKNGNLHFDLNPHNIWLGKGEEIFFADFDEAQAGPLAKDYLEVVATYVRCATDRIELDPGAQTQLLSRGPSLVRGADERDLKFLLARPLLNHIVGEKQENFVESLVRFLRQG